MINATKKWIFLKISSAVLVPLMLWFLFGLVSFYDKTYEEGLLFFTSQPTKLLFSLSTQKIDVKTNYMNKFKYNMECYSAYSYNNSCNNDRW